ncbi:hypothetical protein [Nocardioides pakistanensis]
MSPALLMLFVPLAVGLLLGSLGYALGSSNRKPPGELLAALDHRDALIEDLRETAWEHRDIDPHLSTIFLDKIRQATTKKELP